jgi:hypothetical protein
MARKLPVEAHLKQSLDKFDVPALPFKIRIEVYRAIQGEVRSLRESPQPLSEHDPDPDSGLV